MNQPGETSLSSRGGTTPITAARILVVEDGLIMARDIERRLSTMGYRVAGVASTGEEAVRKARECKPDLVLMDVSLKGPMDGIQAAAQIRQQADIPIVYVTAYSDEATLRRARSTEPFGYVLKPFEERELRTIIEIALYRHSVDAHLRENEKRYRTIAEMTPAFAYSVAVRPDGSLVTEWVTDGFLHTGLTAEALSELPRHVHPDDNCALTLRMSHLLAGEYDVAEYRIITKSGEPRWWRDHARPLWDEAKQRIVRIMGAAQDITERKSAEQCAEAMVSAQKVVEKEVRARLQSHTRTLSVLLGIVASCKSREMSHDAAAVAERVQRILHAYEIAYGTQHSVSLDKQIHALTVDAFKRQGGTRHTFNVDAEDLELDAEKSAGILIILQELLDNALQHAFADGARGVVTVELRRLNEGIAVLRVADTGQGSRREIDLRRAKTTGLQIVNHFVHLLGGTFACEKGGGTRIVVRFPLP
jgi:PAS domain S-box-containing protein